MGGVLVVTWAWEVVASEWTRLGSIEVSACDDPPALLVVSHGYIGPKLVRWDLAVARRFAASQTGPWSYFVDPTAVIPNPVNIVFLRSVRRLPLVARYVVIARAQPMRSISRVLVGLGGPHAVCGSLEEARSLVS
jgi:hypothetical protein